MTTKQLCESIRLLTVVQRPCISEKASLLADKYRQFVFMVVKTATKPMIKQAIEVVFNVKVSAVQVLNVKGKVKRFKKIQGKCKDWKKAYVTLQEGYDLEFTDVNWKQGINNNG